MTTESRRIKVSARIENLEDVFGLSRGAIEPSQVRSLAADDAMVDPEVLGLLMPSQLITRLGLRPTTLRAMRTPGGAVAVQMYEAVRLIIQERDCVMEVQEIQGDSPILVGRIPLLALDWVIDPTGQRLIGNPEHGGDWIVETYRRCAVLPSREFLSRTSSRALVTAMAERSNRTSRLTRLRNRVIPLHHSSTT